MVAGFLVYNYVDGVEEDALGDAKLVPVLVVEGPIARGQSGEEAGTLITQSNIPQQFKPANAITSVEDIAGKVAVSDLAPGQVVVADLFVDRSDPAARKSNSEYLRKIRNVDMTAITISVDAVSGVSGLIEPGDYVNVLLRPTSKLAGGSCSVAPTSDSGEQGEATASGSARYLYQKAEVLAVDTQVLPQAGQAATAEGVSTVATNGNMIT